MPPPVRQPDDAGTAGSTANAATSVRSACQALEQLERSLLAGGFREGAGAYTRMSEVILAQRMFVGWPDREDFLVGVEGLFELAFEAPGIGNRREASGGAVDVARAQVQLGEQQRRIEVARLFVDELGIGLDGRRQLADPKKLFRGPDGRLTFG